MTILWKPWVLLMYYGESHTAVDEKGRIFLPVHFKALVEVFNHDTWFLTRGFDNAIFMFPSKRWEELIQQPSESGLNPQLLDFRRMFIGSVAKVKLDAQKRLNVPAPLRDYAGIDREAVLLGVDDHLELWSVAGWKGFQEQQTAAYKQMAAELYGMRGMAPQPKEG